MAIAQAIVEELVSLGRRAVAVPPGVEALGERWVVSQSGRELGVSPAFMICQRRSSLSPAKQLVVGGPGIPEWMPLTFVHRALARVRHVLEIPPVGAHVLPAVDPSRVGVLLARGSSGPLVLARAALAKLAELPLLTSTADELGHGLHARIWSEPTAFEFVLVRAATDDGPSWEALRRWAREIGVPVKELSVRPGPGAALAALDATAAFLEEVCRVHAIDWRTRRVPIEHDWLRDATIDSEGDRR